MSAWRLTDAAFEDALRTGEHRAALEEILGEDGYRDLSELAKKAERRAIRGGPKVLILPGIMGSKLGRTSSWLWDDVVWFDPLDVLRGNLIELKLGATTSKIQALGVFLMSYVGMKLHLRAQGFDADYHAYDWRVSLQDTAALLRDRIRKETGGASEKRKVMLVAHSMGGLVARAAWPTLGALDKRVSRLVMLGTPNHGSFAPVQAILGTYPAVRSVAALDLKHDADELSKQVFSGFPGLYEMFPFPAAWSDVDLYDRAAWPTSTPRPRTKLLADVAAVQEALATSSDRWTLIAGVERKTVVDLKLEGAAFRFYESDEGDGTVPLAFAKLDGVPTYYVKETHGNLANNADVQSAVVDILRTGSTEKLSDTWTSTRRGRRAIPDEELRTAPFEGRTGEAISLRERRSLLDGFVAPPTPRARAAARPPGDSTELSSEPLVIGRRRQHRIDLTLAYGDITQADVRAIVLGEFRGVQPNGAARAVDDRLDGALTEIVQRRMFGACAGEMFILPTGRRSILAESVVLAGMGPPDGLDEEVLRLTAQNIVRTMLTAKIDEFATVMIGSGSGFGIEEAIRNLVQGFVSGLLAADQGHRLRGVTICEFDKARFEQLKHEVLRLASTSMFDEIQLTVQVIDLPEAPRRAPTQRARPRSALPTYLFVQREREVRTSKAARGSLRLRQSVLPAKGGATVVTDVADVDEKALDKLLATLPDGANSFGAKELAKFGPALGQCVLTSRIRDALDADHDAPLVVVHDAEASRIPWETLHIGKWAPAGEAGLTRQYAAENLSVAKWLEQRRFGAETDILLVVNPTSDLEGAEREGDILGKLLATNRSVRVTELRQGEATRERLREEFRSGRYDVVHYAGHAFFDPDVPSNSGIWCAGDEVLSGADLAGLANLPALVFFNACEAGRIRARGAARRAPKSSAERIQRNVGLAEAFLRGGVENYVGTYWPVGDDAAEKFAMTFYTALLDNESVGTAVLKGRATVKAAKSVDWADYVLYGAPDFVLKHG